MTADGSDRSFGAPRFDVVLRGYDRRQVDEHLSRLQRVLSRMRADLEAARNLRFPPGSPGALPGPAGPRRPSPRRRPDGSRGDESGDVVDTFTERMQSILQAAEEEAGEIRTRARSSVRNEEERLASLRSSVRTEEETARATLTELVRQRDAVLADLTRVRGQLESLLSGPTSRIAVPEQGAAPTRRDAGAGQPLPGTSATPTAASSQGPEAPERAGSATTVLTAAGVDLFAPSGPAADDRGTDEEDGDPAAVAEGPDGEHDPAGPAPEPSGTAVDEPADTVAEDHGAEAARPTGLGDTVQLSPVEHPAADDEREPQQVEPASASPSH